MSNATCTSWKRLNVKSLHSMNVNSTQLLEQNLLKTSWTWIRNNHNEREIITVTINVKSSQTCENKLVTNAMKANSLQSQWMRNPFKHMRMNSPQPRGNEFMAITWERTLHNHEKMNSSQSQWARPHHNERDNMRMSVSHSQWTRTRHKHMTVNFSHRYKHEH